MSNVQKLSSEQDYNALISTSRKVLFFYAGAVVDCVLPVYSVSQTP